MKVRTARNTTAVAIAIALGTIGPVAAAGAQPDRGPHKSTPHSSSSGGGSQHVRHGAEPDRSPHKSTPGGNNNDNHVRYGAEPDRSPHKVSPGQTGNLIPGIISGRGTHPGPSTATPRTPAPAPRTGRSPSTPGGAAQQGGAGTLPGPTAAPQQTAPATPPTSAVPATPQRPVPTVQIGSVAGGADIPGSSIISNCDNGCLSADHTYGTTRVYPQSSITPDRDPRTTTVTIDPESPTARGGFSGNLVVGNPNLFSGGKAGVPVPDRGTIEIGPTGGDLSKPGKGATLDVTGRSQYELRIARAVPDGSYPVNTVEGPSTAVHYHYDFEARSITGIGINGIELNNRSGWAPVTRDQADSLIKQGVPRPRVN